MTFTTGYDRNGLNASYRKYTVAIGNPHMFNYGYIVVIMLLVSDHFSILRY